MSARPDGPHKLDRPRPPIDWAEIRRRVDEAGAAGADRAPEIVRQLLDMRAHRLAEPEILVSGDSIDAITFGLAGEVYAIAAEYVSGVFELTALTVVPGADEVVLGITEWRGELLTILDLRRLLGLPVAGLNDLSMVVALGRGRPSFGILADTLRSVTALRTADLYQREANTVDSHSHVHGLMNDATIVLNAQTLLSISPTTSE